MSRYVYISCAEDERKLPEIEFLCDFLRTSRNIVQFAPQADEGAFCRLTEDAIERSDAFVAVIGPGHSSSTQLNFELHHAHNLRSSRMSPRPRIFGLQIAAHPLARVSTHIEIEWLQEDSLDTLLADGPAWDTPLRELSGNPSVISQK